MRRALLTIALLAILVPGTTRAQTTIDVDGGFYRFGIDQIGAEVTARDAGFGLLASNGGPFSFELLTQGTLLVWDFQQNSEVFQVFINGIDQGLTSNTPCVAPGDPGCVTQNDPFLALADPVFSRGIYNLMPGLYEVSVITNRGFNLPGSGAIGVTSEVPEPATMLLFASGLVGFAVVVRRRRYGTVA